MLQLPVRIKEIVSSLSVFLLVFNTLNLPPFAVAKDETAIANATEQDEVRSTPKQTDESALPKAPGLRDTDASAQRGTSNGPDAPSAQTVLPEEVNGSNDPGAVAPVWNRPGSGFIAASNPKKAPSKGLVPPPPPTSPPTSLPAPAPASSKRLKSLEPRSDESSQKNESKATRPEPFQPRNSKVSPYTLGPGDLLTIVDPSLGSEEEPYEKDAEIAPDGTVSIYPVGSFQAEGLTIGELTQIVNNKERALVEQPQVVVILRRARPVHVHVLGDVASPGLYSNLSFGTPPAGGGGTGGAGGTITPSLPLQETNPGQVTGLRLSAGVSLSATDRPPRVGELTVLTAIQLAGGVKDTADIRNIRLSRAGENQSKTIDLERMLVEGDFSQDITLRSGDNIFVPKGGGAFLASALGSAAHNPRPVRIIGEVNRPGLYYLGPKDDLVTILAKAGGFDVIAKQRTVLLSRLNHDGTVTTRTVNVKAAFRNSDKAGRLEVMPGDVVFVSASIVRRVAPTVGYVVTIAGLFSILSVLNAALPVTFMRNLTRGNNSNGAVGSAFFGFGLSNGLLFGTQGTRGTAPNNIP